ncbi:MAG: ferritin [Anaerolineales bacterium]|nr:ferritin [Anaerolineales bacterium]MCS7248231.1 ferritin [Anaerolineales bacterium]MDW8162044.1 ferritin [Anaerolineales bacterium]MDW8447241.1 ferritin [Anaerolineales bacterium]
MLPKAMQDAMNEQIKNELYSAYLYLSMAAHYESKNLSGFANWLRVQAQEELGHAMRFYNFILERGGTVTLKAIDQPPSSWDSNLEAFQQVLAHEQKVTKNIHDLYALAVQEKDYPSQVMLQWFVDEQVEEEKSATEIIEKLKLIGDHGGALLMLDHELGQRKPEEEEEEE